MEYNYKNYTVLEHLVCRTPVISNDEINGVLNAQLFFKCENLQITGSFKYRGAIFALLQLDDSSRSKGVVTVSSGNHGAALARACRELEIEVSVIVPQDINSTKLANIRKYSPEVIFAEPGMQGRKRALELFLSSHDAVFIPPYDHIDIVRGQASAAFELAQEIADLDYLVVPIGGGGLASGSILALRAFSPNTRIIGAEPANANDAYRSIKEGRLVPQFNPDTICDGLKASLGAITFPIISNGIEEIILVSESEILSAMKSLHAQLKMLVEPSSSTVYAAILKDRVKFENKKVGLILSGGNLELEKFYAVPA